MSLGQRDERLGQGGSHRVGRGDHRRLGHRLMLDQHALQLERADPVTARFEYVVGAPDIGQAAIRIPQRDVAGAIGATLRRSQRTGIVEIALHERGRRRVERDGDLALLGLGPVRIEQPDRVAGRRPPHRPRRHRLPRHVADLQRRLGLAIAVADRDVPRRLHPLDHLRVQRLARRQRLAHAHRGGAQIRLHQHAPHRRRRAERRHALGFQDAEQARRVEAGLIEDQDRRAGVPRREEA